MEKSQDLEIRLLQEALQHRCGFDIRHYAQASLRRRLLACLSSCGIEKIAEAIPLIIHDESFFQKLVFSLSVTFTEFFRDPFFFRAVRTQVVPILKTYPFFNSWHAGCSTGEEVYSMAILLQEEGLYDKSQIYATDYNDISLQKAIKGVYSIEDLKICQANYKKAGGKGKFSDYYSMKNDCIHFDPWLKKNMVFSSFNLVTDSVFTEVHLGFCRNVLIYFDRHLQNRVLSLLNDSLVHGGLLCLGSQESLKFSHVRDNFKTLSSSWRIFQKRVTTTSALSSCEISGSLDTFRAVVMGCSAGGMHALRTILSDLPQTFPVPIIVIQHRIADADPHFLTDYLNDHCLMSVVDAEEKEGMVGGKVYVAPPGFHLMLEKNATFALTNDPKHNHSRPAIDILFESACDLYGQALIAVLLTGANSDGARALRRIKDCGGMTFVQDPETAESTRMPRSAIEFGAAKKVIPLSGISRELCLLLGC